MGKNKTGEMFLDRAKSFGSIYGSAKGPRNIALRIGLINDLVPMMGEELLDIGCGNGKYTQHLATSFNHIDAVDVEPDRLQIFRDSNQLSNITIHNMSADDLKFDDETFDAITAIEVLEHVTDIAGVLKEAYRVLKKGGWFALTTPNRLWPLEQHGYKIGSRSFPGWSFPGLVWCPPLHRRFSDANAFTVNELKQFISMAGLGYVGHKYMFPPLDSLADGHLIHKMMATLEQTPIKRFAQTLIMVAVKPW